MENNMNDKNTSATGNDGAGNDQQVNTVMHSDFTAEQEKKEEDFPGYPHYPASEDLLNPLNNDGKVDVDVENLSQSSLLANIDFNQEIPGPSETDVAYPDSPALRDDEDDIGIVPGTEADVTAEDLLLLGEKDQDMDMGEDEDIRSRSGFPVDRTGDDLDVPGAEVDDANEDIGEEDEENNYYSLGGDEKDNLQDGLS
jgi:hypothetical protein